MSFGHFIFSWRLISESEALYTQYHHYIVYLAHGVGEPSLHRVEDVVGVFQQPVVLPDLITDVYCQCLERSDLDGEEAN